MAIRRGARRPPSRAPQQGPRATGGRVALYAVLILGAIVCLMPFLFMLSTSLKTTGETITRVSPVPLDPRFWPRVPQWINFARAWSDASFSLYFRNSVITAGLTVLGVIASS